MTLLETLAVGLDLGKEGEHGHPDFTGRGRIIQHLLGEFPCRLVLEGIVVGQGQLQARPVQAGIHRQDAVECLNGCLEALLLERRHAFLEARLEFVVTDFGRPDPGCQQQRTRCSQAAQPSLARNLVLHDIPHLVMFIPARLAMPGFSS